MSDSKRYPGSRASGITSRARNRVRTPCTPMDVTIVTGEADVCVARALLLSYRVEQPNATDRHPIHTWQSTDKVFNKVHNKVLLAWRRGRYRKALVRVLTVC